MRPPAVRIRWPALPVAAFRSLALLAVPVAVAACAENDSGDRHGEPVPSRAAFVVVTPPPTAVAAPGDTVLVSVHVRIDAGHHVMANPASESYLVPLRLEVEPSDAVAVGPVTYPEAVPFVVDGIEKPLATYRGEIVLVVALSAAEDASAGAHTLTGTLHYQGCNRHACLIPSSVPVGLRVEVR